MSEYTHRFKLKSNGSEVSGKIEFNHDGITSFDFDKAQMTAIQLVKLQELFVVFKSVIIAFGEVEKLELEKE